MKRPGLGIAIPGLAPGSQGIQEWAGICSPVAAPTVRWDGRNDGTGGIVNSIGSVPGFPSEFITPLNSLQARRCIPVATGMARFGELQAVILPAEVELVEAGEELCVQTDLEQVAAILAVLARQGTGGPIRAGEGLPEPVRLAAEDRAIRGRAPVAEWRYSTTTSSRDSMARLRMELAPGVSPAISGGVTRWAGRENCRVPVAAATGLESGAQQL